MEATQTDSLTPMMGQYQRIKEQYPNTLLFFRLGDFYETFFEDAVTASRELDLTLTSRDRKNKIPMAGVPYHAVETYLSRLIRKGFSVTVCDQMEDPRKAKGIVKREVIRTITPGTLLEENLLEEKKHNFMLSICSGNGNLAIAYCDISTADFFCTQFPLSYEKLEAELSRLKPAEVLLCGPAGSDKKIQ
ncbi:MAG: DNA mismatch repair protein MutS, partial [Candidatus Wallbacteria bacterium]|nr:DNA mismatch repair protein MutS [Candidatus Wallbacteria bacterium]